MRNKVTSGLVKRPVVMGHQVIAQNLIAPAGLATFSCKRNYQANCESVTVQYFPHHGRHIRL